MGFMFKCLSNKWISAWALKYWTHANIFQMIDVTFSFKYNIGAQIAILFDGIYTQMSFKIN